MHLTLESESQVVNSDAVDANRTPIDRSRLTAVNVMSVVIVCTGTLAGLRVLKYTPFMEWASVRLPDSFPAVTTVRSVPYDPVLRGSAAQSH